MHQGAPLRSRTVHRSADTIGDLPSIAPGDPYASRTAIPWQCFATGSPGRSRWGDPLRIRWETSRSRDTVITENSVEAPNPPVAGRTYHGVASMEQARSCGSSGRRSPKNAAVRRTGADVTRSGGLHLYNDALNRARARRRDGGEKIVSSDDLEQLLGARRPARWWRSPTRRPRDRQLDHRATTRRPPTRTGGVILNAGGDLSRVQQHYGAAVAHHRVVDPRQQQQQRRRSGDLLGRASHARCKRRQFADRTGMSGGRGLRRVARGGLGNLISVDPVLAPLAFNGGTSRTHAVASRAARRSMREATRSASPPISAERVSPASWVVLSDMRRVRIRGTPVPLTNLRTLSQFGTLGTGNGRFSVPGRRRDRP